EVTLFDPHWPAGGASGRCLQGYLSGLELDGVPLRRSFGSVAVPSRLGLSATSRLPAAIGPSADVDDWHWPASGRPRGRLTSTGRDGGWPRLGFLCEFSKSRCLLQSPHCTTASGAGRRGAPPARPVKVGESPRQ